MSTTPHPLPMCAGGEQQFLRSARSASSRKRAERQYRMSEADATSLSSSPFALSKEFLTHLANRNSSGQCHACSVIGLQVLLSPDRSKLNMDRKVFHKSWAELEECAIGGCMPCRYIRQELLRAAIDIPKLHRDLDASGSICWSWDMWSQNLDKSLLIEVMDVGGRQRLLWLQFRVAQEAASAEAAETKQLSADETRLKEQNESYAKSLGVAFASNLNMAERSDSDLVFEQAKIWLRECEKGHELCKSTAISRLPARLLEVSLERGPSWVRLVESQDLIVDGRNSSDIEYCAFSYCWGPAQINETAITVSGNYAERSEMGFEMSALPKTLRDAVIVCRRLGQKYVWIDALCIIQDSKSDWEAQVHTMKSVYNNACFTLVASSTTQSDDGLFKSRPHYSLDLEPFLLAGREMFCTSIDNTLGRLDKRTWRSRGWTMQEERLSGKLLYWDDEKLYWRCQQAVAYEAETKDSSTSPGPTGFTPQQVENGNDDAWNFWCRLEASTESEIRDWADKNTWAKKFTYDAWRSIILGYSDRKLTHHSDSYPAIEGLAVLAQLVTEDQLACGLWQGQMHEELLWYPCPPDDFRKDLCSKPSADEQASADNILVSEPRPLVPSIQPYSDVPAWSWFSYAHSRRVGWATIWDFGAFTCAASCACRVYSSALAEVRVLASGSSITAGPSHGIKLAVRGLGMPLTWTTLAERFRPDWGVRVDEALYYQCEELLFLACRAHPSWEHKKKRPKTWGGHNYDGLLLVRTGVEDEYRRVGVLCTESTADDCEAYFVGIKEVEVVLV